MFHCLRDETSSFQTIGLNYRGLATAHAADILLCQRNGRFRPANPAAFANAPCGPSVGQRRDLEAKKTRRPPDNALRKERSFLFAQRIPHQCNHNLL